MPVADYATYCRMLDQARERRFAYPMGRKKDYDPRTYLTCAETSLVERVKQAVRDLGGSGSTIFTSRGEFSS